MKMAKGLFVMVFLFSMVASVYAIHGTTPAETTVAMPGADAVQLYDYIMKGDPYESWELWPGKGKLYKGTEPHGALLTTYVNQPAYFSAKDKSGKMKDGSIIVKENYTPDKNLAALTVIYKIKGYNPSAGNWFWAKYDTEGKVLASGKVESCIGCHGKNKDNDYIMTEKIKKMRAGGY
jgi:hypothetical protein